MRILYTFDNPNKLIDMNILQAVADYCEIVEGLNFKTAFNIRFTDDDNIKEINNNFRGINKSTDVLSFPSIKYNNNNKISKTAKHYNYIYDIDYMAYNIGDTIISVDKAVAQAKEYGHGFNREIAYIIAHSIFHLFGYDHIKKKEKEEMRKMEEKVLDALNISREDRSSITDEVLVNLAIKAMERSYSPYSKFPVGACLLSKEGNVYQGCNVENAAYGLTMCAERTAVYKAVSEGITGFQTIAIAGKGIKPYPCGSCRQVLNEFSPNIRVLVTDECGNYDLTDLTKLLPHGFGPESLNSKGK